MLEQMKDGIVELHDGGGYHDRIDPDTEEGRALISQQMKEEEEILKEIEEDSLEASKNGATGTPTFFIGTEKDGFVKLVGAKAYASFQEVIDSKLT